MTLTGTRYTGVSLPFPTFAGSLDLGATTGLMWAPQVKCTKKLFIIDNILFLFERQLFFMN